MIIGNILGDGHINFRGNKKCYISYGYANEEYSMFVLNKLKGLGLTNYECPSIYKSKDKRYEDKIRTAYFFKTFDSTEIFDISKYFLQPYIIVKENSLVENPSIQNITSKTSTVKETRLNVKKLEINIEDITSSLINEKKNKF